MNKKYPVLGSAAAIFLVVMCAACAGQNSPPGAPLGKPELPPAPVNGRGADPSRDKEAPSGAGSLEQTALSPDAGISLEQIAEIERDGTSFPGLALAESALREQSGDYAGAAVAAYKELSRAFGHGAAGAEQVDEGLRNALSALEDAAPGPASPRQREEGSAALKGCAAFSRGDWKQAEELLAGIPETAGEPDSFLRWMLLVCAIEQQENHADFQVSRSAYGAIRARYQNFPEYWYRGARAFSRGQKIDGEAGPDGDQNIAAAYAEQCINVSPQGPFAAECRKILAVHLGIPPNEGGLCSDIRTRVEIESTIRASVSANNPEVLEELFPLIALPDNPYTFYAVGAMRSLSSVAEFRTFFIQGAHKSPGRLGERLKFISRG